MRHILVKQKALADKIYQKLATSDAQFAALAKKYTIDPGSKKNGGQLGSIQKGQTVPSFDKVAFSAATGKVSKPVKSSYGWHVIEATADTVPASQKPLDAALKKTIRTSLLTQKKQSVANKWFTAFQKKLEKSVRYAAGMAPPKTTSTRRRRRRDRRRPQRDDSPRDCRVHLRVVGAVVLAGCGGSGGSSKSKVPNGSVKVVDGTESRSPRSRPR